jgi:hypothetical protein
LIGLDPYFGGGGSGTGSSPSTTMGFLITAEEAGIAMALTKRKAARKNNTAFFILSPWFLGFVYVIIHIQVPCHD